MLTKEEKFSLQDLPKVKEELEQTIQFLEQLANSKGTISEDRYKQLENKYNTKISELKAKKEKIIDQFEEKKDELKIQQGTLQSRKQETSNNLKEITQLKGQSAISDEEYKQQSRQYNNQLREINRESSQINKDFEEIDFYFNAKGDVNFQTSKLKNKISTGTSVFKKLSLSKIFNWKIITLLILIILIPITLMIYKKNSNKISVEKYFEDFSNNPIFELVDYSPQTNEYFKWDKEKEIYRIRILEEDGGIEKFVYTPEFQTFENKSFSFEVDIKGIEESWGMSLGMTFVYNNYMHRNNSMHIYYNGTKDKFTFSDEVNSYDTGNNSLNLNIWYHISLKYNATKNTVDIFVTERDSGILVYQIDDVPFKPSAFNKIALGHRTNFLDGDTFSLHYDNILIQYIDSNKYTNKNQEMKQSDSANKRISKYKGSFFCFTD